VLEIFQQGIALNFGKTRVALGKRAVEPLEGAVAVS
jgi:hypothetical protein